MKQVKLIVLYFLVLAAVSCQKENTSAVDNLPLPDNYAEGVDSSVKPGDSFFDYCNGAWLKKQDPHPARNIGGLYDGDIVMQQRVEQLKQTVPDIGRFYQLLDNIYTQPEKELAFINAKKAAVKKPESKEEAFRTIGKMVAEGAPFSSISFYLLWDMDQLKGVLVPPMSAFNADEVDNDNLIPLTATKATVSQAVTYIVEGMGMNPDLFMTDPEMDFFWEELWNMSLDEIYEFMLGNWDYLQMYATEVPETTKEKVQSRARATLSYTLSYHLIQQIFPKSRKEKNV